MNLTLTLQAGRSLTDYQLGFMARGLIMDNPTGQWWYIPAAGRYVMPFTVGNALPLSPTQVGEILAEGPPGVTSNPASEEVATATFLDTEVQQQGVTIPAKWTVPMTITGSEVTLNVAIQSQAIVLNVNISSSVTLNVNIQSQNVVLNVSIQSAVTLNVNIQSSTTLNVNIASATTLNINIMSSAITLNMNLLQQPSGSYQSILFNGGFDTGDIRGWFYSTLSGTGGSWGTSTDTRLSRGYSLKLQAQANSQTRLTSLFYPVTPGQRVHLTYFVKRDPNEPFGAIIVNLNWANSNLQFIAIGARENFVPGTNWEYHAISATPPENAVFCYVEFTKDNAGYGASGSVLIDDVDLFTQTQGSIIKGLSGAFDLAKYASYTGNFISSFNAINVTAGASAGGASIVIGSGTTLYVQGFGLAVTSTNADIAGFLWLSGSYLGVTGGRQGTTVIFDSPVRVVGPATVQVVVMNVNNASVTVINGLWGYYF